MVVYVKFRYHFQDKRTKGFSVNSASIKGCKVSPEKNPRQWQRCKDERQSYSLDETSLLHDKNCEKMLPKLKNNLEQRFKTQFPNQPLFLTRPSPPLTFTTKLLSDGPKWQPGSPLPISPDILALRAIIWVVVWGKTSSFFI